mgnify:CR=1 FL=1
MTQIKHVVSKLIKKHKTNDPYEITSQKNIIIQYEQLGSVLGYHNTYRRIQFIHINSELEDYKKRFVCAHELGHALLHPNVNTPFLRKNTFYAISKIEREANEFAVELLLEDKAIKEHSTVQEAAVLYGIPKELIYLKKKRGI